LALALAPAFLTFALALAEAFLALAPAFLALAPALAEAFLALAGLPPKRLVIPPNKPPLALAAGAGVAAGAAEVLAADISTN
jgi:hypothetical protein